MMSKYLKQLTQISILNFFFILGLLFFVQTKVYTPPPPQVKSAIQSTTPSPIVTSPIVTGTLPTIPISSVIMEKKDLYSELSAHNSKSNCWLAVSGHIYDVTTYFGSHPGGDGPIQKYCGQDATSAFQSKDGIGADHSASAYDLLHQYLIQ